MALTRAQIKLLQSLKQKKYRQRYNKFGVEGEKIALELLTASPRKVELAIALPAWAEENRKLLESSGVPLETVSGETLEKISSFQTPNKFYLLVSTAPASPNPQAVNTGLSLYLDGIQDPGNLGTILRIADWFGLSAVFCAPHSVEWANPKAIQASMGSFFRTPVEYLSLTVLRERHPALPVYAASMDGESVYSASVPAAAILVIGSESHGISAETAQQVNAWLGIPSFGEGKTESLNAAVATGILCAVIKGKESIRG